LIEGTEECDGSNLGGETCVTQGFVGGSLGCQADCTFDTSLCTGVPVCGDNTAEGVEVCDGTDLAGEDCVSQGFTGGTLACTANCTFDTSGCTGGPVCGDNIAEGTEVCDGTDLAGENCVSQGFTGGTLACTDNCTFDTSGCTSGPVCGDGVAEAPEDCDGTDLADEDCVSQGFTGGTLACTANCTFDTSGCTSGPVCGDNVAEAPEVCDGSDLGDATGLTCAYFEFTGGTLACNATCDNVDLTACAGGPPGWTCPVWWYGDAECDCGCGVIDLLDCADGTVASCDYCGEPGSCSPLFSDCPGDIDPTQNSLCLGGTAVCGDGVAEPPEQCDGVDLQGLDCTDSGFTGGTLGCMANCTFDTSGCTGGPVCGDDTVQWPELCDGTDLGFWTGATCVDFYFVGGTLVCNATCDNLNLTACTGGPPGWTCNVLYYDAFDGCDCGCGVIDPDCIDDAVASCEWCDDEGSCSPIFSGCPGDIDPDQNWLCGTGGTGGAGGMPGTGGSGGA
jgi:hypothetical protein